MTTRPLSVVSKISIMLGMCFVILLFHVWLRSLSVAEGYRVSQLRREVKKLNAELLELHVVENRLMGPQQLEKIVEDQRDLYGAGAWIRSSERNTVFVKEDADRR